MVEWVPGLVGPMRSNLLKQKTELKLSFAQIDQDSNCWVTGEAISVHKLKPSPEEINLYASTSEDRKNQTA